MSTYKLLTFAGVTLPIYNVQLEMPAEAPSPVIRTVNGFYDVRGGKRQIQLPAMIRMRAVVATNDADSESGYLIVNGGNRLVVNGGNPLLIVNQSAGQVREMVDKYRGLIGELSTLTRAPFVGTPTAAQSIAARLLSVRPDSRHGGLNIEELEMSWEAAGAVWSGAAGSASGANLVCNVGGNAPVQDATLTITGAGVATRVTGPGIDWSFAGAGQTLVVKGWSATANGAPTAVTLNAAHTAESLLELQPGVTTAITASGGASVSLTWNDKWV